MGKQVAKGELAGNPRIVHPKVRQPVDNAVVPMELSLIHQNSQSGRCEGLRVRANTEHRVGIHTFRLADQTHAETLGIDEFAILHHADRDAGHGVGRHGALDDTVDIRRLDGRRRSPIRIGPKTG